MNRRFVILFISVLLSLSVMARVHITARPTTERPTTSSYCLEWGYSSALDTYLSPLKYTGQSVAISGQWQTAMRQNPKRLIMGFDASLNGAFDDSPAKNSNLYALELNLGWNMQYRWRPLQNLQLSAGGGFALNAGVWYLERNSNNPASARASIDLTINAMASYKLKIGKLPIRLVDQLSIPTLGAFFSPEYGESYYEIYLGNHSGLVHCGWWGNHFRLNNLFAADFSLGNINLRLGYRLNIQSSYVNNINTQMVGHSLVVGVVTDWLNITDERRKLENINLIPAIY